MSVIRIAILFLTFVRLLFCLLPVILDFSTVELPLYFLFVIILIVVLIVLSILMHVLIFTIMMLVMTLEIVIITFVCVVFLVRPRGDVALPWPNCLHGRIAWVESHFLGEYARH